MTAPNRLPAADRRRTGAARAAAAVLVTSAAFLVAFLVVPAMTPGAVTALTLVLCALLIATAPFNLPPSTATRPRPGGVRAAAMDDLTDAEHARFDASLDQAAASARRAA